MCVINCYQKKTLPVNPFEKKLKNIGKKHDT